MPNPIFFPFKTTFSAKNCETTEIIDIEPEIKIDGLKITLPVLEDKWSQMVGDPDFCTKKFYLLDSEGRGVTIYNYN